MSTITTTPVAIGALATAASANATYTAIATGTASLDFENTQTEWVSMGHVDESTNDQVFNTDLAMFCNSAGTYTLVSESYAALNLGGTTPVRITFAPNLTWARTGEILRVHADINVDDVGEITLPSIMGANQDCFYLSLFYQDNAGNWHQFPNADWAYSITNYTEFDVTNVVFTPAVRPPFDFSTDLQTYALTHPRKKFRCSITGFLPPVALGIKGIELRGRLEDSATIASVTFKEATLTLFMMRN